MSHYIASFTNSSLPALFRQITLKILYLAAMFHFAGLGREQFVDLGILQEVIRKGQDDIDEEQQPVPLLGVGHIGNLFR